MSSAWNRVHERLAEIPLCAGEGQVFSAILRKTLGWRKVADRLSATQLVEATGLDRRNVQKWLKRLEASRMISRSGGGRGRGNAATVALNLNVDEWIARLSPSSEKASDRTSISETPTKVEKASDRTLHKASDRTPTRGKGVKNRERAVSDLDLKRLAFDAYLGAGGELVTERERGALARGIATLEKRGTDPALVQAAARDLGRKREFPGLLAQRAKEIETNGGPCENEGLSRPALTVAQLRTCGCPKCSEWVEFKARETAEVAA